MNTTPITPKHLALAAVACTVFLPLAAHAQTFTDNAANPIYAKGYTGLGGDTPGFGAFKVVCAGVSAGTFVASASEAEAGNGNPGSIDTGGKAFGMYAQTPDAVTTVTRTFRVSSRASGLTSGDSFSLDFVTGYNDGANGGGSAGVALVTAAGPVGDFHYQSGNKYFFNGAAIPGQQYATGALHLVYTLTSATAYSLKVTGAVTYSGSGTYTGPITGFQVQQKNAGGKDPAYNAYFNAPALTCVPAAP